MATRRAISLAGRSAAPLSPAIVAGGVVYCSGQVGADPATGTVPADIRGQTRVVIENLQRVLRAAGADLADVAKCTVFLTRREDFAAMNEVYAAMFPEPHPARSTVVVAALARPGLLVEIEAIAPLPEPRAARPSA